MSKNPSIKNINPYDLVEVKRVANSIRFSDSFHFDPKNSVLIRFEANGNEKSGKDKNRNSDSEVRK